RKLVFFFLQLRIKHKKVLMEFLPPTPESIEPQKSALCFLNLVNICRATARATGLTLTIKVLRKGVRP
ncbi:hypothetical protein, partial [Weissella cibaria]|uniref:hypothetical protein n=1 Tax=Weissella cibaria TaxID=137591 RepID=UPI00223BD901